MSPRPAKTSLLLTTLLASTLFLPAGQPSASAARPHAVPAAATTSEPKPPASPDPIDTPDFLVGLIASREDDHATAARSFAKALAADPGNADLLRQTFSQAALAGSPEAATLARENLHHPGGRSILSAFILGNDAAIRGQWDEAARAWHTMPADALTRLLAPLFQAWSLAGNHKYEQAVHTLLSPPDPTSPAMPFYLTHAGLIAAISGDTKQAGHLYEEAWRQMPGRDLLLTRARAALLWQEGRQTDARNLMRQLTTADSALAIAAPELQATLDTSPVTTPQQGVAHAYVLVAFLMHQQARHMPDSEGAMQVNTAAAMMLHMALSLDPKLALARLMLAETEQDLEHREIALSVLDGIAPTDPLIRLARYRRALLDDALGNPAAARQILDSLVHDEPQLILPWRTDATLLFEQKDWNGAIAAFSKAIDLARADHSLDWTLLFGRAAAYERAGNWTAAEADIQEARKIVPDEPLILNFLGYGWVQRGMHEKDAITLLERALALDPDDAAIRDSLGWAWLRAGNLNKAEDLLEHAAEQTPLDPEVNYHLGVAYWNQGRKTEAIDQWNVALTLKPEPEDLVRIHKALDFTRDHPDAKEIPLDTTPSH